ncbi:MAG: outer membrane beta-barrel domain-containing protein, partial [Pseudomonadales bacterium]
MESRFQRILLNLIALMVCSAGTVAFAADPSDLELEPLVVREPDRREVDVDKLDHENIEIGIFGGIMSVEDFGSDTVTGVRFAYHVTEDFFVEAMYGQTELGLT